ncbi:SLC22A4_5 [Lepeophtheirus salmonis]|uniref:SLC22A4_5 n=1 Tax=Lepeophtheirus salmonis TaxID=72036 RepID=A0A7R8HE78_LEPSM|nr:SLC22A4_5 [Lepeophtheirus salmonis]CAF3039749.1 SLC22A4_5 [Lepeophtheirus salmonis]
MITAEYIIGASAFPVCFLWFFVPESPRWYLSMGKLQKANTAIKNIAKFNGIHFEEISSSSISSRENPRNSTKSIMDLFRYPGIRRNFIIMCLNWFGFTMGYYGLVYNTPTYDFNIYLVFVFPTFFAIPLNFVIPLIENHIGRKPLLTGSMILSGVALLVSLTLVGHNWPVTMCSIFGTVVSFAAMSSGYIFCKELFPTVLRTTALSFATVAARLGSILSPIVGSLDRIHPALPIGVYGLVSLTGGILSIWLWPETKKHTTSGYIGRM